MDPDPSSDEEEVTDRLSDGSPEQPDLAHQQALFGTQMRYDLTQYPLAAAFKTLIKQKRRAGAEARFRRFAWKLDKRERGLLSCSSIFGYTFSDAVKKVMPTIDGTTDTTTDTTTATGLAPTPAPSAANLPVDVVRDTMAGVKGQPKLMAKFTTMVKAFVKQKQRGEAAATSDAPKPNRSIRNMIFGGESGTGKSSGAKALADAMYRLGLVEKPVVRIVDKRNPMERGKSIEEQVCKTYAMADGGVIFFDEIHQRDDPKFIQAFLAATDPDGEKGGRVVTIIAGYTSEVETWLTKDPGMSRRFPRNSRIEFEKLKPPVLYELGVDYLAKRGFQLEVTAHDAMRACAKVVYDYDPPENAGGMKNAVDAMVDEHDAKDELAPGDMCITANHIFTAVPAARGIELDPSEFIAPPAPSPQAEEQAVVLPGPCASVDMDVEPASPPKLEKLPSIVDAVVDAFKQRRAQEMAQETAGSSHSFPQAPAQAEGSSITAPVDVTDHTDSDENVPLTSRVMQPSRKRKQPESSSEAAAPEASNEVKAIVHAIDVFYEVDAKADQIVRKDFFTVINGDDDYVKAFNEDVRSGAMNTHRRQMNTWLNQALKIIAARCSHEVKVIEDKTGKQWVSGLRLRVE